MQDKKILQINRIQELSNKEVCEIKNIETECNLSNWSLNDYKDEAERDDSIFLTASRTESPIIGYLVARFTSFSVDNSLDTIVTEANLLNFGVLESFQRNGVGRLLFGKFFEEIIKERVETIWLEVRKSNENAVRFYLKRNFKIVQIRKNFYVNPPEDALVMKHSLAKYG